MSRLRVWCYRETVHKYIVQMPALSAAPTSCDSLTSSHLQTEIRTKFLTMFRSRPVTKTKTEVVRCFIKRNIST